MKIAFKVFMYVVAAWLTPAFAIAILMGWLMDLIECIRWRELPDIRYLVNATKDTISEAYIEYFKKCNEILETM